jgi:hypothetical protein
MNATMESFPMLDRSDLLRRTVEAYIIGQVEALRVNLEFFIECVKATPSGTFPERFGGVLIDTENLLNDIKTILNRPSDVIEDPVTDAMVEAAKQAMSWEGSVIPEEEQATLMRDVLTKALQHKNESPILL